MAIFKLKAVFEQSLMIKMRLEKQQLGWGGLA
jgi:hypothetical protein